MSYAPIDRDRASRTCTGDLAEVFFTTRAIGDGGEAHEQPSRWKFCSCEYTLRCCAEKFLDVDVNYAGLGRVRGEL